MKFQVSQEEIIAALKQYISSQGINVGDKDFRVDFTTTRKGGARTSAEVVIGEPVVSLQDAVAKVIQTTKTTVTPAAAPVVPVEAQPPVAPIEAVEHPVEEVVQPVAEPVTEAAAPVQEEAVVSAPPSNTVNLFG